MKDRKKFERSLKSHESLRTKYSDAFCEHLDVNHLKRFCYHAECVLQMNYKGRCLTKQEKRAIYKKEMM